MGSLGLMLYLLEEPRFLATTSFGFGAGALGDGTWSDIFSLFISAVAGVKGVLVITLLLINAIEDAVGLLVATVDELAAAADSCAAFGLSLRLFLNSS